MRSVNERNVAWRHVQQINPEFFEGVEDTSDLGPAVVELLALVRFPIGPDTLWELGARVEVGTGEIQNEWPLDDGHFEHPHVVVRAHQLRHVEPQDRCYDRVSEPRINSFLPFVGLGPAKCFDRDSRWLSLAFRAEYDTVFSRAQRLGEFELMPVTKQPGVRNQGFVHDSGAKLRRALRR